MELSRTLMGLIAVVLAAVGCSSDPPSDRAATDQPDDATAEAVPEMAYATAPIDPQDVEGYLEGMEAREADRLPDFDPDDLVEIAVETCTSIDGELTGQGGALDELVVEMMLERGYGDENARFVGPDVRSAMEGTICDVERVEAP